MSVSHEQLVALFENLCITIIYNFFGWLNSYLKQVLQCLLLGHCLVPPCTPFSLSLYFLTMLLLLWTPSVDSSETQTFFWMDDLPELDDSSRTFFLRLSVINVTLISTSTISSIFNANLNSAMHPCIWKYGWVIHVICIVANPSCSDLVWTIRFRMLRRFVSNHRY